jgi:hypothetical protein
MLGVAFPALCRMASGSHLRSTWLFCRHRDLRCRDTRRRFASFVFYCVPRSLMALFATLSRRPGYRRRDALRRFANVEWLPSAHLRNVWNIVSASRLYSSWRLASVCQHGVVWRPEASLDFIWNSESASRRSASVCRHRIMCRVVSCIMCSVLLKSLMSTCLMACCKIWKSLGPTIPITCCTFVSDQSSYYEAAHKQTTDTGALSVCARVYL